ncbi:hypothetical protein [Streptomyces microflavus]|uniref:hypothetical protein n=1 Tax=Streptomyces microflavus TaxID=1919 RepID=UPI0038691BB7|nr:hypothetical protein OG269_21045 [Streptomyces microflavus]
MSTQTTSTTTPALHVPLLQPVPVEGCTICGAAASSRTSARSLGSTLSERAADETIRQHPHRRSADRKGVER